MILIASSSPYERMRARTVLASAGWRIEDVDSPKEADRAYDRNGGFVVLVIDSGLLDGDGLASREWQALRASNPFLRAVARSPIPPENGIQRVDGVTYLCTSDDHEGLHEAIELLLLGAEPTR